MPHARPDGANLPLDRRRREDLEDVLGIVLRAFALAAIALCIGVAASLLLGSQPAGYLAIPAAKP